LNNLILKILPDIENFARRASRHPDTQNELIQSTVLKCYEYEFKVKQMHAEGKLNGWLFTVIRNENLKLVTSNPVDALRELADVGYTDRIEELKPFLTDIEKKWLKVYVECDGSYTKIEQRTTISRSHASKRIKSIIEKCKKLKFILE